MVQPKDSVELSGIDVELKEAVCDALVNMVTGRASGTDEVGRTVHGRSPRRSIFSGQLLPRRSRADEDETSDIKIAAIGFDFNMRSGSSATLTAIPRFSVYVRILPEWEEISSDRYGIEIDFKLNGEIKAAIDAQIRERRTANYEKEGIARPNWKALDSQQAADIRKRRREIQDDVRTSVYAEHGITLRGDDIKSFDDERSEEEQSIDVPSGEETGDETITIPTPAIGRLITAGRAVPAEHLSPAPIPGKWRRVDLVLPICTWSASATDGELHAVCEEFSVELRRSVATQLANWLENEGESIVWRDRNVRPADARSEGDWNRFIAEIRQQRASPDTLPDFSALAFRIEQQRDFMDPSQISVRVTLDNGSAELSARDAGIKCNALFGTGITLRLPKDAHVPLHLDRVEPSYRFRDFLFYPAIGLNCGIDSHDEGEDVVIETTWAPRFTQPRIVPRGIEVECRFSALAEDHDVAKLLDLPREYLQWIAEQETSLGGAIAASLAPEDARREIARFEEDLAGQRIEAKHIERGVRVLIEARAAATALADTLVGAERERLRRKAAPWFAWRMTNESFARRDAKYPKRGWRLFQLAFILAHIPTFASRMKEYADEFDVERDEQAASLLYFPTGGGKSEAFYGALLFAIFLDRLRGKDRGVTAMIRYPLRLLTLQQAQRLLRLIANAELVRKKKSVGTWPIEIGFWVGSANTPNRYSAIRADLPDLGDPANDDPFEEGVAGDSDSGRRALRYREAVAAYNKVPRCPCCEKPTGLRRFRSKDAAAERAAIVCFDASCPWNDAHGIVTPLPFLLTDDTIYQRAPAIVLGTVDKLAMLGQNTSTITNVLGMFGLARWKSPEGHLSSPSDIRKLQAGPDAAGASGVFPAYHGGTPVFHDPFPSLIIQDEAHLLEDSLGTFSGLFDTLLEQTFRTIDEIAGDDLQVCWYLNADGKRVPRLPKMIAATATISDPDRQLKTLYQRKPLRFPYPGPDIYRSFFAEAESAPSGNGDRVALSRSLPSHLVPEATAPWMRLYVSLMTNDATHTVTTVGVLSSFHTIISHLWAALLDPGRAASAVAELHRAISPGVAGDWRRAAIDRAVNDGRIDEIMALVDLHRIALCYVTNKKGGDQVIDALHSAVRQKHHASGLEHDRFISRLISGGVDMQEIQRVMKQAETPFEAGYPNVGETLRSIVATSAISHGVDVDRFNSMFFAGLPSDIAEYIQASSRVGRTHVGFVMLLPTPQSRRDRYVVETHDIFHRFLERMIAPPAVERWAENAIRRVQASYVQAWAMLNDASEFVRLDDSKKADLKTFDSTKLLSTQASKDIVGFSNDLASFMLSSMGVAGRDGSGFGKPPYPDFYRDGAMNAAHEFGKAMRSFLVAAQLKDYWGDYDAVFKKPMTSLRDVDEAGVITASVIDPGTTDQRSVRAEDVAAVMKAIRGQRGDTAETDADVMGEA
ncbi:helicase [Rhizobium sp. TRM95111]|uniref:DEAD/DEAH box helicase n=1 Tax=Rhizobium alarense TaxID=2846851 RepID=UPI001F36702A|nr:helicase-related protein [Rhizobium alarense]MCF3638861.1 helicase [Rhizobium alarense]